MAEIEVIGPRAYRAMPGPQTDFLLCPIQDVFFGGARGGSKTFSCLMDAANRADKYGKAFRGLFLRRTLEEFPEVNRAAEELFSGIGSTYNKSDRLWTFRRGGTLRMRYLADDADAEQYMGHQLAAIYIDEAGNFPNRSPIDKLWGALRSPEGIPCVMRLTGNPGGPGHCVDAGEVLTPFGWKDIRAFSPGDPVFTVADSGEMVATTVAKVHRFHHEGDLVRVSARGLYMSCTPNHSVAKTGGDERNHSGIRKTSAGVRPRFSLVPFEALPGQATILRSVSWAGSPIAPVTPASVLSARQKPMLNQPTSLSGERYAAVLGWFLAEGHLLPDATGFSISQFKTAGRDRIRTLLSDCGFSFSEGKTGFFISSRTWGQHFAQFGKQPVRWVPAFVKNATTPELSAFLLAIMDGDGHWEQRGKSGTFYTTSRQLADDVAEIALRLGFIVLQGERDRANRKLRSYSVSIKQTKSGGTEILTGQHVYAVDTKTQRRSDVTRVPFSGLVYCLEINDTHTFILRQRGSVWVSGNSHLFNRYVKWGHKTVVKWRPQPKLKPDFFMESVFIRSLLEDNVELMKADPDYENRLFAVGDEDLVRAWRYGDWSSLRGGYFAHTYDPARNIYASAELEPYFTRWAAIDWGYAHHSAIYFACFDGETTWVYKELILKERTPTDLAEDFARAVGNDKLDAIYLSPDAFARRSTPRAISDEMNEVMRWHKLPAVQRADNSRVSGWQLLSDLFRKGTLKIHESCETLRRAIPTTQRNPDHPEDVLKTSDVEDDARDALRYLLQSHPREAAVPPEIQIRRAITAKDPSWQLVQWENARRKVLAKAAPMRIGGRPR